MQENSNLAEAVILHGFFFRKAIEDVMSAASLRCQRQGFLQDHGVTFNNVKAIISINHKIGEHKMALPSMQLTLTLVLAHLFILLVLYLTWLFVKHAQKKHHEHMTVSRLKSMPKLAHHELEKPVVEEMAPKAKRWDNTAHEVDSKELEAEQAFVHNELKQIDQIEPLFTHADAVDEKPSMEERVSKLPNIVEEPNKSVHQEQFESHIENIRGAVARKGLKNQHQVILNAQLDTINQEIASLDHGGILNQQLKTEAPIPTSSSNKAGTKSHQDWRDEVAKDFEKLHEFTAKQAQKKGHSLFSVFSRSKQEPFVAMHKGEVEKKALDLVIKISKRIEGDHPIPPKELDWIEASLQNVHRDLWSEKDNH